MKRFIIFLSLLFFSIPLARAQDKESWIQVAMHMSTTASDGSLSLDQIVSAAREEGVKAVIVTDRDFMKWEYGLWPLRHILKKTILMNSVFRYGIDKYMKNIYLESSKNPDMLVIAGLESAPFYYWKGDPMSGDFTICDWHKHVLVVLPDVRDYRALPVFMNSSGKKLFKKGFDVVSMWPFLTMALGILIFRRRKCNYVDIQGRELGRPSKRCRCVGALVIIISLIFLANNYPFRRPMFDQYCPVAGDKPYQALLDYVNSKNGLTFWAHPEATNNSQQGRVLIETGPAISDLWGTTGYTGFSVFHEGYEHVGKIGGDWDQLLKEYCAGKRAAPIWASAGLAFDQGSLENFKNALRSLSIAVSTKYPSERGVLDAMKNGRMVVTRGPDARKFSLDQFFVIDDPSGKTASMGQELIFEGLPILCIKGGAGDDMSESKITIVRDGAVFKELRSPSPFDIVLEDEKPLEHKTYYRLEIRQGGRLMITNPIFVSRKIKQG